MCGKRGSMQLTRYSDYSLRVLIFLASGNEGASVREIATFYGISQNHLAKIVASLAAEGLVATARGRGGGLRLAVPPANVQIGVLIRAIENLDLVECFNRQTNTCPIATDCAIETLLNEASAAFMQVLDGKTLADLLPASQRLVQLGKRRSNL